ncbi:MAG TPA: hypothetical protein VFW90_03460 [Candidatus Saccharimonadales bacterium]|nr:hypothetical protein [Candidatus Saccharimonadales bacterium]
MSAVERDFSNFRLEDNVYELADGVIADIAERLDVPLGQEPNSADLQLIMGKVGQNRVLRQNQEVEAINRRDKAALLDRSKIQSRLSRSLWTPDVPATPKTVSAVAETGAVANWFDRGANMIPDNFRGIPLYFAVGNRVMDTVTEIPNRNVKRLVKKFKRYPTESEYGASIIAPKLDAMGHDVLMTPYPTRNGDDILAGLFEDNPHLLAGSVAMARVANAGIVMAVQMRNAARKFDPAFDSDPSRPQTFIITDEFPLARTKRQEGNPAKYQKTDSAMRQLVLSAKMLHEAAGGE